MGDITRDIYEALYSSLDIRVSLFIGKNGRFFACEDLSRKVSWNEGEDYLEDSLWTIELRIFFSPISSLWIAFA